MSRSESVPGRSLGIDGEEVSGLLSKPPARAQEQTTVLDAALCLSNKVSILQSYHSSIELVDACSKTLLGCSEFSDSNLKCSDFIGNCLDLCNLSDDCQHISQFGFDNNKSVLHALDIFASVAASAFTTITAFTWRNCWNRLFFDAFPGAIFLMESPFTVTRNTFLFSCDSIGDPVAIVHRIVFSVRCIILIANDFTAWGFT